jgi:hypothetical protein
MNYPQKVNQNAAKDRKEIFDDLKKISESREIQ